MRSLSHLCKLATRLPQSIGKSTDTAIQTGVSEEGKLISIRIKDNGIGISDQVKQKIFDHLFTTKAVGEGTGLGLSIARQIVVEKHGGWLEVNSSLGHGSEFVISIPVNHSVSHASPGDRQIATAVHFGWL